MNTKLIFMALGLAAGFGGAALCPAAGQSAVQSDNTPNLLRAIRQVESGDRDNGPRGKGGEFSAYQFSPAVWRQYTDIPFSQAPAGLADTVAARHCAWIIERLKAAGVAPTSWNIAAAWNCGAHAVATGRIPASTRDYATRVVNLMR